MMSQTSNLPGVGVVVGRFQTPHLHNGHKYVLDHANKHHKLLIFVGVHRAPGSFRNEMDFETRKKMLQKEYPNAIIMPIQDEKLDSYWTDKLENLIHVICPLSEPTLYHGRKSFAPHYKGDHTLVDVGGEHKEEATALREQCYGKAIASEDFRAGQFYYSAQVFPRINPCVDLAITKMIDGELHLALGAREADPDNWRFPGGHIDRTDPNMEFTCEREAEEETNLAIQNIRYISSRMIDDWRNTRTNGTMTTLFHCDYAAGKLQGGDDIAVCKWVSIKDLPKTKIVSAHKSLMMDFLTYIAKLNWSKKK